ncbi:hypothetical protein HGA88_00315 [Candidatus Roizmanbacteria bacterium]|nr:hypothetical protein [Candidatus Roizmanbacteria bacterium]
MTKELTHAILLIVTVVCAFIIGYTPLVQYDLQIAACLFILLYVSKKLIIPKNPHSYLLESIIFTYVVLQIIASTGGIHSLFFFLVYFLLFSLSLLLEPIISITTTLALIAFFIGKLSPGQEVSSLVPILSLAFISPFALYLGSLYQKTKKEENEIDTLKQSIVQDKTDTFLFLSTVLKNHIRNIEEAVTTFMGDKQLSDIQKNTQRMKKLIDTYEQKK